MNHCTLKALCLLALLPFMSPPIKAQTHPCGGGPGPNEVQVGEAPGGNGVAPTPICNWMNGGQSQGPQRPPMRWADQWGAIATDGPGGHLGKAADTSSKQIASNTALDDCKAKGGNPCKVEFTYYNQCVAMVIGETGHNSSGSATIDQAVRLGIKTCRNAGDTNCHAFYTACSLPKLIQ